MTEAEAFQKGVEFCIGELRELQDKFRHQRHWNFSNDSKFAPVELSDYLVKAFKKKGKEVVNEIRIISEPSN